MTKKNQIKDIAYYFWMPPDLHKKLKLAAAAEGVSVKSILIDACKSYFGSKESNGNAQSGDNSEGKIEG